MNFTFAYDPYSNLSLELATLPYIYSIQFAFDGTVWMTGRQHRLDQIQKIDDFFSEHMEKHTLFYLGPCNDDQDIAIVLECSEPIDDVLMKMTCDATVLKQFTMEEFNEDVERLNKERGVRRVQENMDAILAHYAASK